MSFTRHKKGSIINDLIIPKIVEFIFDSTIFVRTVVYLGLSCLNHIFLPLKDVDGQLSTIPLIISQEDVKDEGDQAIICIYIKFLDRVHETGAIGEMNPRTEDHAFSIFTQDHI